MSSVPDASSAVLDAVDDPDFGRLNLTCVSYGAALSGERIESKFYSWDGRLGAIELRIAAPEPGPLVVPPTTRAIVTEIIAREAALRDEIAGRLLTLAQEWAASGDLDAPSRDALAAMLTLSDISVDEDLCPTLYFCERESDPEKAIFAGHVIEVRCDPDGAIREANIAG